YADGMELALFTTLKQQPGRSSRPRGDDNVMSDPGSVRLELVRCNVEGRLTTLSGASLLSPLQGPATVECGALLEVPNRRLRADQSWVVTEESRPPRTWT